MPRDLKKLKTPALGIFVAAMIAAIVVGIFARSEWIVQEYRLEIQTDEAGNQSVQLDGETVAIDQAIPFADTALTVEKLRDSDAPPAITKQFVERTEGDKRSYWQLAAHRHWGWWSFLPAATAIALCWITKEPITALLSGILVGAMMLGEFNIAGVLVENIGTPRAATILILYLWLLGGLMGIWTKTGASEAFADYMSKNYVRGPKSAKFVAWLLGIVFFQGGTVSAVLVGTTVRPLADEEKVSHEELSLIVDSTSSPIAVLLAFNAWPVYVQAFMSVAGVAYLATQEARIAFFYSSIVYSFYALFAVTATLLIALELHPLLPAKLKRARQRARETGELNAPNSEPLAGDDPNYDFVPKHYQPNLLDFLLPLGALLGVAIGTYLVLGSPNVLWAFGAALMTAAILAACNGLALREVVGGVMDGMKGVVFGSVILLLAITVGSISQQVGGGHFLVSLLGGLQAYWALPATAFAIAVAIAFSTGTSWATFAVTLPLVMPLAVAVAANQGLAHPERFVSLCFVACLNGGVFGDQCSPISDTTILSSMCTGADLMDHVTTQIPVAMQAALLALIGWTTLAWYCA
ncbi:MAG: Na+/H+ antiporter NhaC family protein [Planctomycetota bacterium]